MISSLCKTAACLLMQFPFGTAHEMVDDLHVFQTPTEVVYVCEQFDHFYECLPINGTAFIYTPYH